MRVRIGARASNLSRVQMQEVIDQLASAVEFERVFCQSRGDRDLSLDLRQLDKSDVFTDVLDQMLLEGAVDVTVHSAKDLPEPLAEHLEIVALTKGVDSSDSLVMRAGDCVEGLVSYAKVASTTPGRDAAVHAIREDFTIVPVRGTIEMRLEKLENREFDALVMAEAAIVRLQLFHLNRITLNSSPAPLQGRLAVVARKGDHAMAELFKPIDWRRCDEADAIFRARSLELSR